MVEFKTITNCTINDARHPKNVLPSLLNDEAGKKNRVINEPKSNRPDNSEQGRKE